MPSLSFRLRGFWRFALVVAVAFGCSEAMTRLGWLEPLENVYYDYWHQFAGKRRDAKYAAVVAVDEQTLNQYKDDPLAFWQPHFARAMETLTRAGAKVIGLDYLYQVSAEDWLKKLNLPGTDSSRSYDSPFRAQLAAGNKILITQLVELSNGEGRLLLPPRDHLYLLPRASTTSVSPTSIPTRTTRCGVSCRCSTPIRKSRRWVLPRSSRCALPGSIRR